MFSVIPAQPSALANAGVSPRGGGERESIGPVGTREERANKRLRAFPPELAISEHRCRTAELTRRVSGRLRRLPRNVHRHGADLRDVDPDLVARRKRRDALRRSRGNQIPRVERHDAGRVLDQPRDAPDHVRGVAVLAQLAVQPEAKPQRTRVRHFVRRHQPGTDRGETVEGLPRRAVLVAAYRDVEHAGIPEHMAHGLRCRDVARGATDHHAELDLVIGAPLGIRQPDRRPRPHDRRRRLQEHAVAFDRVELPADQRPHLFDVPPVVERRRHDLAGKDEWRFEPGLLQGDTVSHATGFLQRGAQCIETGDQAQHLYRRPLVAACTRHVADIDDHVVPHHPEAASVEADEAHQSSGTEVSISMVSTDSRLHAPVVG